MQVTFRYPLGIAKEINLGVKAAYSAAFHLRIDPLCLGWGVGRSSWIKEKPKMKPIVSAFIMAALVCLAITARADGRRPEGGYTNADINGGYGCGVSGDLTGANTVGIAQFHPQGNGTFSESVFVVNIDGVGVCQYSLERGSGTYDVSANGTGFAQATYLLQTGSAQNCPAEFSSHFGFVCSGAEITASTCNIATTDPGVLLHGTCTKQNK